MGDASIGRSFKEDSLKDEIEHALASLVGRTLSDAGRSGVMLWLHLGERIIPPVGHGEPRAVAEYALHVSCPWRLIGPDGIHVAAGDLFTPADPSADLEDFDWDTPGASWLDVGLGSFLETTAASPRAVSAVSADDVGSLRLLLGDDFVLDLFPDSSNTDHVESEFWRLVQPGTGAAQFVVGSFGIDRVPEA